MSEASPTVANQSYGRNEPPMWKVCKEFDMVLNSDSCRAGIRTPAKGSKGLRFIDSCQNLSVRTHRAIPVRRAKCAVLWSAPPRETIGLSNAVPRGHQPVAAQRWRRLVEAEPRAHGACRTHWARGVACLLRRCRSAESPNQHPPSASKGRHFWRTDELAPLWRHEQHPPHHLRAAHLRGGRGRRTRRAP